MKNVRDLIWAKKTMFMQRTCMEEFLFIRSRTHGKILIKYDTPDWATKALQPTSLKLRNSKVFLFR